MGKNDTELRKAEKRYLPERQNLVVKNSDFIQKGLMSLGDSASSIMNYLVSKIKPNDRIDTVYRFNIGEYIKVCGRGSGNNYAAVRNVLNEIDQQRWWLKYEEDDKIIEQRIQLLHSIRGIRNKDGSESKTEFEVMFHEDVFPYFFSKKMEHKIMYELGYVTGLRGIYCTPLYELLKTYQNVGRWKFGLGCGGNNDLHQRLAKVEFNTNTGKPTVVIPDSWSEWRDFSRRVIVPNVEKINKYSDITVSFEGLCEDLQGRKTNKVTVVDFRIRKKTDAELDDIRRMVLEEKGYIDSEGRIKGSILSGYETDIDFIAAQKRRVESISEEEKNTAFNSIMQAVLSSSAGVTFVDAFNIIDRIYYNHEYFLEAHREYCEAGYNYKAGKLVDTLVSMTMRKVYEKYLNNELGPAKDGVVEGFEEVCASEVYADDEVEIVDGVAQPIVVGDEYKDFKYLASKYYKDEIFGPRDLYAWEEEGEDGIPDKLKYFEMSIRHLFWNAFGEELTEKNICSLISKCFMILNRESGQGAAVNYIYHYIDKIKNSDSETHSSYFARLYDSVVADYDEVKFKYM